ncbi:hypothetical protein IE81DRAFT_304651 [Ceraceosorus guamensis]|uniref:Nucleoporin Nup159/Nup146 N-terminal domain-containing protein n=1 Tax=Ceraceosorus guamensis TaxID=1522189 RepID=A0A316VT63_9BASI|nr:hypothetical protein IE81DRAFT_304651 [Ceraceosorus guamensis]PWN40776.1 hypothetical protein IE81DRAFT_304651 [Ceraceosorus guamensis]
MPDYSISVGEAGENEAEFLTLRQLSLGVKARLSKPLDVKANRTSVNLLAVSSRRGLLVAATDQGLAIHALSSLRSTFSESKKNTTVEPQPIQRIPTPAAVSFLRFADDDERILVGLENGALAIWTLEHALDGNSQATHTLQPPAANLGLLEVAANPGERAELSVVLYAERQADASDGTDGQARILDMRSGQWGAPLNVGSAILSACWSTKGKQIALGLADGGIVQLTPEGEIKERIRPPTDLAQDMGIIHLSWLENNVFVATYNTISSGSADEPDHSETLYAILRNPKTSSLQYLRFPLDPAPSFGDTSRRTQRYAVSLKGWSPSKHLLFLAASASTDVGVLLSRADAFDTETEGWESAELEETSRPTLPFSSVDKESDTAPVALAVDLSATENVDDPLAAARGEDGTKKLPPCPILLVYTTDGVLLAYHVINTTGAAFPGMLTSEAPSVSTPAKASQSPQEQTKALSADQLAPTVPSEGAASVTKPAPPSIGAFGKPSVSFGSTGFSFGSPSPSSASPKDEKPKNAFSFGQSSADSASTSAFGNAPAPTFQGTASAFGQQSAPSAFGASTAPSAFGKTSAPSAFGATAFGAPSAFGQGATSSPFAFGKSTTSAFGSPSKSASPFGPPSASSETGSSSSPARAFGAPSVSTGPPSAFANQADVKTSAAPAFGSTSAFGSSGFGQPSAFGQSSAFGKGASASGTAFGQTSAFGKPSSGQSSAFGKGASASGTAFGQTSAFGKPSSADSGGGFASKAASNALTSIGGSSSPSSSGSGAPSMGGFGAFSNAKPLFGAKAADSSASIFGEGGALQSGGKPAFGQRSPSFGLKESAAKLAFQTTGFRTGPGGSMDKASAPQSAASTVDAKSEPSKAEESKGTFGFGGFGSLLNDQKPSSSRSQEADERRKHTPSPPSSPPASHEATLSSSPYAMGSGVRAAPSSDESQQSVITQEPHVTDHGSVQEHLSSPETSPKGRAPAPASARTPSHSPKRDVSESATPSPAVSPFDDKTIQLETISEPEQDEVRPYTIGEQAGDGISEQGESEQTLSPAEEAKEEGDAHESGVTESSHDAEADEEPSQNADQSQDILKAEKGAAFTAAKPVSPVGVSARTPSASVPAVLSAPPLPETTTPQHSPDSKSRSDAAVTTTGFFTQGSAPTSQTVPATAKTSASVTDSSAAAPPNTTSHAGTLFGSKPAASQPPNPSAFGSKAVAPEPAESKGVAPQSQAAKPQPPSNSFGKGAFTSAFNARAPRSSSPLAAAPVNRSDLFSSPEKSPAAGAAKTFGGSQAQPPLLQPQFGAPARSGAVQGASKEASSLFGQPGKERSGPIFGASGAQLPTPLWGAPASSSAQPPQLSPQFKLEPTATQSAFSFQKAESQDRPSPSQLPLPSLQSQKPIGHAARGAVTSAYEDRHPPFLGSSLSAPPIGDIKESGIAGECLRLYLTIEEELKYLRSKAEACATFQAGLRQPWDEEHSGAEKPHWTFGDLPFCFDAMRNLEKDVKAYEDQSEGRKRRVMELQSIALKAEAKREEASRFIRARSDAGYARLLRVRELGPEHVQNQDKIRAGIHSVRTRVQELAEVIESLKREVHQERSGSGHPLQTPSLESIRRSITNLSAAVTARILELDQLETELELSRGARSAEIFDRYDRSPEASALSMTMRSVHVSGEGSFASMRGDLEHILPDAFTKSYAAASAEATAREAISQQRRSASLRNAFARARPKPLLNIVPSAAIDLQTPPSSHEREFSLADLDISLARGPAQITAPGKRHAGEAHQSTQDQAHAPSAHREMAPRLWGEGQSKDFFSLPPESAPFAPGSRSESPGSHLRPGHAKSKTRTNAAVQLPASLTGDNLFAPVSQASSTTHSAFSFAPPPGYNSSKPETRASSGAAAVSSFFGNLGRTNVSPEASSKSLTPFATTSPNVFGRSSPQVTTSALTPGGSFGQSLGLNSPAATFRSFAGPQAAAPVHGDRIVPNRARQATSPGGRNVSEDEGADVDDEDDPDWEPDWDGEEDEEDDDQDDDAEGEVEEEGLSDVNEEEEPEEEE